MKNAVGETAICPSADSVSWASAGTVDTVDAHDFRSQFAVAYT